MLTIGLWIASCSNDTPTQPSEPSEFGAADLVQSLAFTIQQGIIAAQAGQGTVAGVSGEFKVVDMQWIFARYSPAGEVFIDGEMTVDAARRPMVMRGELDLSGSLSGVLKIDLAYNLSNGVFDGTITVGSVPVAMSERLCCVN